MNLPSETPLYELTAEFLEARQVLSNLDLPDQVISDTLEALRMDLEAKALNVAGFVLGLESTADAILIRIAEMRARAERIERRAQWLRQYLLLNMQCTGTSKISSPEFEIAIRQCPAHLVVDSENSIHAKWWREPKPQPLEVNKQAILDEIRQGREVEGCHAEKRTKIEIK